MGIEYIGKAEDLKQGTTVIYCQASIDTYLSIVGSSFGEYLIQRRRESHKAYKRLSDDIRLGALLPTITLSVKPEHVDTIMDVANQPERLKTELSVMGRVDILDGLQRTYILKDISDSGFRFNENAKLLLEFWLEKDLSKLIYRMIVLNSGQKTMSMRHQIELLFTSLSSEIEKKIPGITILKEKDSSRRTQSNKYPLSDLATSYYAYLTGSHEIEKDGLVTKLFDSDILDASEEVLTEKFNSYLNRLKSFVRIDELCWNHYSSIDLQAELELFQEDEEDENFISKKKADLEKLARGYSWLGSENTMLSFFSMASFFDNNQRFKPRFDSGLETFISVLEQNIGDDPLAIVAFENSKDTFNPRKKNIGFATRKLTYDGLKEFFNTEASENLKDCWKYAADYQKS